MKLHRAAAAALLCLLLAGCASSQEADVPSAPKYEGYVDEVVVALPQESQEAAPAPLPQQEETSPTQAPLPPDAPEENHTQSESALPETPSPVEPPAEPPAVEEAIRAETQALSAAAPALPNILTPTADGVHVHAAERAEIDYSNTAEGYVMTRFTAATDKRLKVQVKGPSTTYTYDLKPGVWEVFPLSDGNGAYQVSIYENVKDSSYALVTAVSFDVRLQDEFAPYLLPNQYVNYAPDSAVVARAAALTGHEPDTLKKVELVYDFVVSTLTYDAQKAAAVKSGYVPVLDTVLAEKKGICFDYAALMAAMLRSQGVPCKLVVGYAGAAYHAWISVWSPETGWVDGAIFFDGHSWQRMDPTFASSGQKSDAILQFIGDGKNYTAKYLY